MAIWLVQSIADIVLGIFRAIVLVPLGGLLPLGLLILLFSPMIGLKLRAKR